MNRFFPVTGEKGIFLKAGNIFLSVGWKCRTASARIVRHPHVNGVPISKLLRAIWQSFLYYLLENPVLPITESCTTYYRKLYYLLQKAVLPIRKNCNTHLRLLCHISEKACHIRGTWIPAPHRGLHIPITLYIICTRTLDYSSSLQISICRLPASEMPCPGALNAAYRRLKHGLLEAGRYRSVYQCVTEVTFAEGVWRV